jgi:hypothetical protein
VNEATFPNPSASIFDWFWSFFASPTLHEEAVKDLMKELTRVRREVSRECQRIECLGVQKVKSNCATAEMDELVQRKRLVYLFVKDMSRSGAVGGNMLSNKANRDSQLLASSKADRVSPRLKFWSWLFVIFSNGGMLFYVYLFAMNQTQDRQSAWFQSFVAWLIFEIFVSSTGLVLIIHILIPLFVLADVLKLKEKALVDFMLLREKCSNAMSDDQDETNATEEPGHKNKEPHQSEFNAAKYLFPSWRVAAMLRELPESKLILQFSTPRPRRRFGADDGKLSKEYEDDIALTALSQIVLFFLGSFLNCHDLFQDLLVQTLCNSTLGYLGVVLLRLSTVHPLLPLLVVAVLLLCLHFVVKLCSAKTMKKLSDSAVHPLQTTGPQSTPQGAPSLMEPHRNTPSLVEAPRNVGKDGHDDDKVAEKEMEREDEDEGGLQFDIQNDSEDSRDHSLRLAMFLPASSSGSSSHSSSSRSSSDSSSGKFAWDQIFSLLDSKSECSDDSPDFDFQLNCRSSSDEQSHPSSGSDEVLEDGR